MIPTVDSDLQDDFVIEQEPNKTYKLDLGTNKVVGLIDNLDAIKQAVYLILNTERYEHLIYSWDYGIELNDLFGQPLTFVLPELKRRISEALTQDDRIQSVDAFSFSTSKKGKVLATFTVHTEYGGISAEREVGV